MARQTKQKLLLDTNILQYGVSEFCSAEMADLIALHSKTYEVYISSFTMFEIYRGIDHSKIRKTKELVDLFVPVDPDVITYKIAAVLTTCYNRHEATKDYASKYSDGDTLIGASAFRDNAYILTANGNDFPVPFFQEVKRDYITHTRSKAMLPISLIAPDYGVYFDARDRHYPPDSSVK